MAGLATVGAVKSLVYDSVFKRAQEIAASSEKLRSVLFEGEGLVKGTAECIGSSPSDVYVVRVSIDGATAVGDCSCPAGKSAKSGLCKHAVALLLSRLKEIQETKPRLSGHPPEEVVISIASQGGDIITTLDAREPADGREAIQSHVARATGPPASSSKRALPAWMLGVVGSAAGQTESSNKAKSNKKVAEPKRSRPPPPPTKRVRRYVQPLVIANDSDIEEEDPGEVDDAGPIEECPAPAVTEEDTAPQTIDPPSEGAAARERRRLRTLKKEAVVVADNKGTEQVKRPRGRSNLTVSKEVLDQPVRAVKRRRLAKKNVEGEDSDGSDIAAHQVHGGASNRLELPNEDLLFLAREQLERKGGTEQPQGVGLTARVEPIDEEQGPDSSQGRRSSSVFSRNRWEKMTSDGGGTGGALSLTTDDLDLETLKSYSLAASSQNISQSDWPSLNAEDEPVTASQDTHMPTPITTGAVAQDMLNIFFGSLSQGSPKKVPAAAHTRNGSQDMPNDSAAEVRFEAPLTSSVVEGVSVAPMIPPASRDLAALNGELKPKKKSSLKDRVKMLLN